MPSGKWQPFCLGLNVLNVRWSLTRGKICKDWASKMRHFYGLHQRVPLLLTNFMVIRKSLMLEEIFCWNLITEHLILRASIHLTHYGLIMPYDVMNLSQLWIRWIPLNLTDEKSTLVQVMAWCRQATSHYLSQCWPRSMSPNGITRPQWVNNADMSLPCEMSIPYVSPQSWWCRCCWRTPTWGSPDAPGWRLYWCADRRGSGLLPVGTGRTGNYVEI